MEAKKYNFTYNPEGDKYECCQNCRHFEVTEPTIDEPQWEWRCELGCFKYHVEDEGHLIEYDYQVCDRLEKIID